MEARFYGVKCKERQRNSELERREQKRVELGYALHTTSQIMVSNDPRNHIKLQPKPHIPC